MYSDINLDQKALPANVEKNLGFFKQKVLLV